MPDDWEEVIVLKVGSEFKNEAIVHGRLTHEGSLNLMVEDEDAVDED